VRLCAARQAGFLQIVVSAAELVNHSAGLDAAVALVQSSGLRITALKGLEDFEGLDGAWQSHKVEVAKAMLEICQALGCCQLLVSASSLNHASRDTRVVSRDLRRLALMAGPLKLRIVYTGTQRSCTARDYLQAWDLVCEADMPNLGLGLGADTLGQRRSDDALADLEMLDPDKIFLVQLADRLEPRPNGSGDATCTSASLIVFPGAGQCSETIAAQVKKLHEMGYRGDYSFEVVNTDYVRMPAATVAQHALRAALWLGETVLQRSVPLPNLIRLKRTKK
jgi:sugar phosphate isomerase/epimerase